MAWTVPVSRNINRDKGQERARHSLLQFDHRESVARQRDRELAVLDAINLRRGKFCGPSEFQNLFLRGITWASHLFVDSVNVSMLSINPRYVSMLCIRIFKSHGNRF